VYLITVVRWATAATRLTSTLSIALVGQYHLPSIHHWLLPNKRHYSAT
jgi:hypothetical protein